MNRRACLIPLASSVLLSLSGCAGFDGFGETLIEYNRELQAEQQRKAEYDRQAYSQTIRAMNESASHSASPAKSNEKPIYASPADKESAASENKTYYGGALLVKEVKQRPDEDPADIEARREAARKKEAEKQAAFARRKAEAEAVRATLDKKSKSAECTPGCKVSQQ